MRQIGKVELCLAKAEQDYEPAYLFMKKTKYVGDLLIDDLYGGSKARMRRKAKEEKRIKIAVSQVRLRTSHRVGSFIDKLLPSVTEMRQKGHITDAEYSELNEKLNAIKSDNSLLKEPVFLKTKNIRDPAVKKWWRRIVILLYNL